MRGDVNGRLLNRCPMPMQSGNRINLSQDSRGRNEDQSPRRDKHTDGLPHGSVFATRAPLSGAQQCHTVCRDTLKQSWGSL